MTEGDRDENKCAYIGDGVTFKGSIAAPEKIVVHGTVEGDLSARELFVGPTGTIKGQVHVEQAIIEGKVLENIEAKGCLSLRKSGRVEGSASYGEIEIEKGGVLAGEVSSIMKSDTPTPLAPTAPINTRAVAPQAPSASTPIPFSTRTETIASKTEPVSNRLESGTSKTESAGSKSQNRSSQ